MHLSQHSWENKSTLLHEEMCTRHGTWALMIKKWWTGNRLQEATFGLQLRTCQDSDLPCNRLGESRDHRDVMTSAAVCMS